MWFEVPLPFFLRDHVYGLGWERVAVGAMLAVRTMTHPALSRQRQHASRPVLGQLRTATLLTMVEACLELWVVGGVVPHWLS